MQKPNPIPGCPVGLEYLAQVSNLKMSQVTNFLEGILTYFKHNSKRKILNYKKIHREAFSGWDKNNKYRITNVQGQQIYFAFEGLSFQCYL